MRNNKETDLLDILNEYFVYFDNWQWNKLYIKLLYKYKGKLLEKGCTQSYRAFIWIDMVASYYIHILRTLLVYFFCVENSHTLVKNSY